jgi:hypothetical protein
LHDECVLITLVLRRELTIDLYELGVVITGVKNIEDYDLPFAMASARYDAATRKPYAGNLK